MRPGKPIPASHIVKQMAVRAYAARYGTLTFVETGNYLGEMIFAVKDDIIRSHKKLDSLLIP